MLTTRPTPAGAGHRERPALLPQVLADRQCDVDAVVPDDGQRGAGDEVAALVEDAVVRQVVLEVAGHDLAVVQKRRRVARRAVVVDVADDHRDLAEPGLGQLGRPAAPARPGTRPGTTARSTRSSTRVAGEHHLREGDHLGPGGGGLRGALEHSARRCRRGHRPRSRPGRGPNRSVDHPSSLPRPASGM